MGEDLPTTLETLVQVVARLSQQIEDLRKEVTKPRERAPTDALTIREACAHLKVSRATLRRWRLQRRIRVSKIGRTIRIKKAELDRVADTNLERVR